MASRFQISTAVAQMNLDEVHATVALQEIRHLGAFRTRNINSLTGRGRVTLLLISLSSQCDQTV